MKSQITLATCLLCVVVYLLELACGANLFNTPADVLLGFGGSTGPATIGQMQLSRIISCIFIHANLLHLALNLYVLIDFGPLAEASLGRKLYAFIFLVSGAVGALTSILYNPIQVSVGASAAILGLLGALIYKTWFEKDRAKFSHPQLIMLCIFLLYSLLLGFTSEIIDNAAHVGGFFAGMFACAVLFGTKPELPLKQGRATIAAFLVLSLIPILVLIDQQRVNNNPRVTIFEYRKQALALAKKEDFSGALKYLNEAQDLSSDKKTALLLERAEVLDNLDKEDQALQDVDQWLTIDKKGVRSLGLKSLILHKMGRNKEAIEAVSQALEIGPTSLMDFFNGPVKSNHDQAFLFNNRAWFELANNQTKDALTDCDKALSLENKLSAAYDTRGLAFYMLKDYGQAIKDFDRSLALSAEAAKKNKESTDDGGSYYHRALAKMALGDNAGAQQDMERFKKLDYKPEAWEPKP